MMPGASDRPLVSVVTIFLNPAPYLNESIASVLAQTVADIELILVNDGSFDGSAEVAQGWARRDPRVVLLSHPGGINRGTGASRNLGVAHARGHWVTFLDGDDVWSPEHLEQQLRAAEKQPEAGVVVSPTRVWVSWRGEGVDHERKLPYKPGALLPPGALLDSVTFAGVPIPTCGFMFLRTLVPPDGVAGPAFHGLFEDQTMVARLTVRASAVSASLDTSRYRQHAMSAVNHSPGRGHRDPATLQYLDWIEAFLIQHGESTPERQAQLAGVRALFEPRWRFWVWYASRWLALRVLPNGVRKWLRRGRMEASGGSSSRR